MICEIYGVRPQMGICPPKPVNIFFFYVMILNSFENTPGW